MKEYFVILFSFLFSFTAQSQFAEKDSLLQVINSSAPDSVKSDALNEFAFFMFDYNVDSSIILANLAREKAVKAGNVRQQARAIKNIGISYDIKGKTDSAILFLNEALALAKQNSLHPSQANILTDLSLIHI